MHPFRAAAEAGDLAAMVGQLANDVIFHGPVGSEPSEGRTAVAAHLGVVRGTFEGFQYVEEFQDGAAHALVFRAHLDGEEVEGLELLRMNAAGKIVGFTMMIRPRSALLALAEAAEAAGLRSQLADTSRVVRLLSSNPRAPDPDFRTWLQFAMALPEQAKGQTRHGRLAIRRFSGVTEMATFQGVHNLERGATIEIVVDIPNTYPGSANFYASGDVARHIVDKVLDKNPPLGWILTVSCVGAVKHFEEMMFDYENEDRGVSIVPAFVIVGAEPVC